MPMIEIKEITNFAQRPVLFPTGLLITFNKTAVIPNTVVLQAYILDCLADLRMQTSIVSL